MTMKIKLKYKTHNETVNGEQRYYLFFLHFMPRCRI